MKEIDLGTGGLKHHLLQSEHVNNARGRRCHAFTFSTLILKIVERYIRGQGNAFRMAGVVTYRSQEQTGPVNPEFKNELQL
jgi:hypothetical protein